MFYQMPQLFLGFQNAFSPIPSGTARNIFWHNTVHVSASVIGAIENEVIISYRLEYRKRILSSAYYLLTLSISVCFSKRYKRRKLE